MKTKVKVLTILILMFTILIPVVSSAVTPEEYLKYERYSTIVIKGIKEEYNNLTEIEIPEKIEGVTVTDIESPYYWGGEDKSGFSPCVGLTTVKLPETIKIIDMEAFRKCINLETINLPNSLTEIGYRAFYDCSNLSKITIPESVTWMGEDVFTNCDPNLTLYVEKDSYAENYAKENHLNYEYVMYDINNAVIKIPTNKTYTGESIKPKLTIQNQTKTKVLKENNNYKLTYGKNINAGTGTITINGIENYYGTKTIEFNIAKQDITRLGIPEINDYVYTGSEIKPTLNISHGNRTLINGTDYNIKYENNKNIGTAKVTVQAKGNYTGQVLRYFDILKRNITKSPTTISSLTNKTYTGKAISPNLTLKYKNTKMVKNKDYTVKYSNNKNIGVATITITGKGVYTGTVTKKFKILPKNGKIKSLKPYLDGFTIKLKKGTNITGFQIQYSTNSNFKSAKIYRTPANSRKVTMKDLKPNKKYYIRIRTYKNTNGEIYNSAWSNKRSVKTKTKQVKIGKKYKNSDYATFSTIKFKKGKKIEYQVGDSLYTSTFKGTYKQKGNTIKATVEGYSYRVYETLSLKITIYDNKRIAVDQGGYTEVFIR